MAILLLSFIGAQLGYYILRNAFIDHPVFYAVIKKQFHESQDKCCYQKDDYKRGKDVRHIQNICIISKRIINCFEPLQRSKTTWRWLLFLLFFSFLFWCLYNWLDSLDNFMLQLINKIKDCIFFWYFLYNSIAWNTRMAGSCLILNT